MDAPPSLHPTDQTLQSYGLGKLDESSADAVNKHLETCPDCRQRVGDVSSDSFLGRLRDVKNVAAVSSPGGSPIDGTLSILKPQTSGPPPADTLPPGLAEHPDYEIKRELGRGGMGVVYLAHNRMMGRDEVLKVMGRQIMERPGALERFQREIRSVAKLHHPNIVTAYTAFRLDGGLVFAMEYFEGLDLAKLVKAKGPQAVGHAAYFIHQAALGLQYAHEKGTVHRDIKPHNLMLTHDGKRRVIKILDFGLAKATREEKVNVALTSEGQALGTPDYIAPEQILNAPDVDIRADLYSLGGTLYFLLTGRPPFKANSLYDMYQAHISRDADPLNLVRPEVPSELAALAAKMMAKDPARRFQTPAEVADALKPFFKPAAPQPLSPREAVSVPVPPVASTPAATSRVVTAPQTPEKHREDGITWNSLIDLKEPEPSREDSIPALPVLSGPNRRPPWMTRAVLAAAAAAFGFVMLGVIITIIGRDGKKTVVESDGQTPFSVTTDQGSISYEPEKNSGESKTASTASPDEQRARAPENPAGASSAKNLSADGPYAKTSAEEGWVSLFNGKDLTGWEHDPQAPGKWVVRDGVLVGSPDDAIPDIRATRLRARIEDYGDFHFRAEVRFRPKAQGGVFIRVGKTPSPTTTAYAVNFDTNYVPAWTGIMNRKSILKGGRLPSKADMNNRWLDFEIIADGSTITEKVDGEVINVYQGHANPTAKGGISLEVFKKGSVVEYRKIEIKELNPATHTVEKTEERGQTLGNSLDNKAGTALPKVSSGQPAQLSGASSAKLPAVAISGDWKVEGQELVQRSPGTILIGDKPLSSYDLKFKGQVVSGKEGFVALFHRKNDDNVRFLHVGELDGKRVDLGLLHEGKEGGQARGMSIAKGRWYDVLIKVRGAEVWCNLDGQELFHDVDERFTNGQVGLATWDASARYRDIRVISTDGEPLWEGLPNLPNQEPIKVPGTADPLAGVPPTAPGPNVPDGPEETIPPKVAAATRRGRTAKAQILPKAITNSIGMKLVLISAGDFLMGLPKSGPKNPQHQVRITRPFYMGATEVTQWQYKAVTGKGPNNPANGGDMPVRSVTWKDAIAFCDILSEAEREFSRGARYRLPSEAEWEYACRAGSSTTFCFGDDAANLGDFAWYGANSGGKPQPVGQKRPNAWGLYDMHGNVWEWCWDEFDKGNDGLSPGDDSPARLMAAVWRGRGGCFGDGPIRLRSAQREGNGAGPDQQGYWQGFRVVRVQFEPKKVSGTVKSPGIKPTSPTLAKSAEVPRTDTPNPHDAIEYRGKH